LTTENTTLRQARDDYFRAAGFPPDGGDTQPWVVLRVAGGQLREGRNQKAESRRSK
jgi:hypothetical protein